jgi:hypothetical protein
LLPRGGKLRGSFVQHQPGHICPVMAQEEIHRFAQSDLSKPAEGLGVLLHGYMQGISRG